MSATGPAGARRVLWQRWNFMAQPSAHYQHETAEAMRVHGSRAVVVEIAGCGHAPAFSTPEQFAMLERFLTA